MILTTWLLRSARYHHHFIGSWIPLFWKIAQIVSQTISNQYPSFWYRVDVAGQALEHHWQMVLHRTHRPRCIQAKIKHMYHKCNAMIALPTWVYPIPDRYCTVSRLPWFHLSLSISSQTFNMNSTGHASFRHSTSMWFLLIWGTAGLREGALLAAAAFCPSRCIDTI